MKRPLFPGFFSARALALLLVLALAGTVFYAVYAVDVLSALSYNVVERTARGCSLRELKLETTR